MMTDQDELMRFMRTWAEDGPDGVLDRRSFIDLTTRVRATFPDLGWADYTKALDQFALELLAVGRLGGDISRRDTRGREGAANF